MQINTQSKSRSLLGITDLTLVAPIKRGLIPALDSRSYESRLRLLMKTLSALRASSLEAEPTPLIADAIGRIRAIHSFRLAIVGPLSKPQLLLAVTFDGGWEPYMRRIWRDLGPLLDVIFCNCEGYLIAHDHSFAAYTNWVRSVQVDTEFFFNASALSVSDLHYLRESERRRIDRSAKPAPDPSQWFAQALPAVTALYRLTDMYPPQQGAGDGDCLLRATRHLLGDWAQALAHTAPTKGGTATERAALGWFATTVAAPPASAPNGAWDASNVQAGIVTPYPDLTHGCLLLIALKDAAAAHALLAHLVPRIISASDQGRASRSPLFVNLGFTLQGLQMAGVPSGTLDQLPSEFREGMSARAGILGDLRDNHPTRWRLPPRNWPVRPGGRSADCVELSSVHAVVQFVCRGAASTTWSDLVDDPTHPLRDEVERFDQALGPQGVTILSVQSMQRYVTPGELLSRGHFGFVDGLSQPTLDPAPVGPAQPYSDHVPPGDLLLGYENSLRDPPLTGRLWDDSSFLVVRKLSQDVAALDQVLAGSTLPPDDVKAQLMGRRVNGQNLINLSTGNNFNYDSDPGGARCPLQSHVRRANPRTASRPGLHSVPRIMRRGMSYGPLPPEAPGPAGRGLIFMAYNASIAEQFEVIQSWLGGGNSGGERSYAALRDPFLGVPQDGDPHTFVFNDPACVEHRLDLGSARPCVRLEWGVYAFVPSIRALVELQGSAADAAKLEAEPIGDPARKTKEERRSIQLSLEAQKGAAVIAGLKQIEQARGFEAARAEWKIALEDVSARMSGVSRCVWTAVRQLHDGVLRTPYGVLVCNKKWVMDVFENRAGNCTATGYAERMRASFGEIYLGMDEGPRYHREADAANAAIQRVTVQDGFGSAFAQTRSSVAGLVSGLASDEDVTVDVKDIVDEVLAGISAEWFGLPDGADVVAGGWHWRADVPPTCPGHFHSPSRYMFQPNPGPEASETGQRHGKALRAAVGRHVQVRRGQGSARQTRLGRGLFDAIPYDDALLARTLIGAMMGFLPTVDGNLRATLYEWINDRSLWDHQIAYLAGVGTSFSSARNTLLPPLQRTMQLRPVPELTWRTALTRHQLGSVEVNPGDRIVVSMVSAAQECLINDDRDLYPIFGGNRDQPMHPTHACPGYKMAMGVMLGTLAGLLETARLRPTMSPMALRLARRA